MNVPHGQEKLVHARVQLAEPNPAWPELFEHERRHLGQIAGGAFHNIAHFGSTAIPGLRAKPIIDIMASVETLALVDPWLPALAGLGYHPDDRVFLNRRFFRKPMTPLGVAYHLHIVTNADWPDKHERLATDWLIAHPAVAAAYEALKQDLARQYPDDLPAYTAAKSVFLRQIVNDARRSIGLPPRTEWTE